MGWHRLWHAPDLRFTGVAAATGDVIVVAIDAPSIEQIGVWPWRTGCAEAAARQDRHQ
jgi:hypothetical protein